MQTETSRSVIDRKLCSFGHGHPTKIVSEQSLQLNKIGRGHDEDRAKRGYGQITLCIYSVWKKAVVREDGVGL